MMRRFLFVSFLLCLPIARVSTAAENPASRDLPNIVLIISDDQRWSDYGFMGHPEIQTPNIDRLARQSAVFKRGYVPTALCRSSLMTLATGRYAFEHRVCGNDPYVGGRNKNRAEYERLNRQVIGNIDRFQPLAKVLATAGYVSHQSGKWWEGSYENGGFTDGMSRGMGNHPAGRHGDEGLKIGRNGMKPVEDFIDGATKAGQPFFIWYAPFLPHTPHNPPERLLKKYQGNLHPKIARYHAMCEWFDETCGQLLHFLEVRELSDHTMVVYVCDNGWVSAVPGMNAPPDWQAPYAPNSKRSSSDGGVRTPIMYSWPGKIRNGYRHELATSLDIYPTILAAAGIETENMPGLNLLPHLTNSTSIERNVLFGEAFGHDIADIQVPEASLLMRWCIEDQWKLIISYDGDVPGASKQMIRQHRKPPQLYHLAKDPNEEKNVAEEHPDRVRKMAELINNWYPVTRPVVRESANVQDAKQKGS